MNALRSICFGLVTLASATLWAQDKANIGVKGGVNEVAFSYGKVWTLPMDITPDLSSSGFNSSVERGSQYVLSYTRNVDRAWDWSILMNYAQVPPAWHFDVTSAVHPDITGDFRISGSLVAIDQLNVGAMAGYSPMVKRKSCLTLRAGLSFDTVRPYTYSLGAASEVDTGFIGILSMQTEVNYGLSRIHALADVVYRVAILDHFSASLSWHSELPLEPIIRNGRGLLYRDGPYEKSFTFSQSGIHTGFRISVGYTWGVRKSG
jgi:hypothetical protein